MFEEEAFHFSVADFLDVDNDLDGLTDFEDLLEFSLPQEGDPLTSLAWDEPTMVCWDLHAERIEDMVGDNSEVMPSIPVTKCAYQLRAHHHLANAGGGLAIQWRIVTEERIAGRIHCVDIDRGRAPTACQRLHRPAHSAVTTLRECDFKTVLVLRRACFLIASFANGITVNAYPATIEVSGQRYTLHHTRASSFFLFAIRAEEMQDGAVFDLHFFPQGTALVRVRADGNTDIKDGYMIDADMSPQKLLVGYELSARCDGETYVGMLRPALPAAPNQEPEYDLSDAFPNQAIVVKRISHVNDHVGADGVFRVVDAVSTLINVPRIHHGGEPQPGTALSTAAMAPYYTEFFNKGGKANVARGAEIMTHLERDMLAIGTALPFVSLTSVAICPYYQYVITPYMPLESLHRYQWRRADAQLSVTEAQHVTAQLLCALVPLHDRGIAHRNIYPETILFGADDLNTQVILNMMRNGHSVIPAELFMQLHVKLADMSQAARHRLELFPSSPRDYQGLRLVQTAVGTHSAICPEHYRALYLQQPPNTPPLMYCGLSVDMWQVGVLLLIMLTGSPPFRTCSHPYTAHLPDRHGWMHTVHTPGALRHHPVRVTDTAVVPLAQVAGEACMCFLENLLLPNPEQRLTVNAALQAVWHGPWVATHPSFHAV